MVEQQKHRAIVDLYDAQGRLIAAAGTETARIPAESIGWLTEQGCIEPVAVAAEPADAPEEE